jgi:magnesium-protoporphyrin IX monomethyl ester (oxidative) cyclase
MKGYHKKIKWSVNVRANLVTNNLIKIMKDAGCYEARMGVESGNNYILNNIYNRKMTREQLIKAFQIIKDNNIQLRLDFIYGAPTETLSMMEESFDLAKQSNADNVFFAKLYPFPGTEIKKLCEKEKIIYKEINFTKKGMPPVEKTKYVTKKQFTEFKKKISKWQAKNYFNEGFQIKGLIFLFDIFLFLVFYKHKYALEMNQLYRWNVRNYKLKI